MADPSWPVTRSRTPSAEGGFLAAHDRTRDKREIDEPASVLLARAMRLLINASRHERNQRFSAA
jgi:hypothetical protein